MTTSKGKLMDIQIGPQRRIKILESDTSKHENLGYFRGDITSYLGNDVGQLEC